MLLISTEATKYSNRTVQWGITVGICLYRKLRYFSNHRVLVVRRDQIVLS